MKTFTLLLLLTLSTTTAFAMEDTMENRTREADRYISVTPPRELLRNVAEEVALNYPPEKRETFLKIITEYFDLEAVSASMKETMVKVFTADELAALADFYGSPEGISTMKKMGAYMAEIMPIVQAETLKAISRANRELDQPSEKDRAENGR